MIFGFTKMNCGACGVEFYVPDHFYTERRQTKKHWHCPNGHIRVFRESEADELRRERDRLKQQLAQKDDEIARKEMERRAAVGQVTRLKNRAAKGVCPCCNRHFTNLERHMATKHPTYTEPAEARVQ